MSNDSLGQFRSDLGGFRATLSAGGMGVIRWVPEGDAQSGGPGRAMTAGRSGRAAVSWDSFNPLIDETIGQFSQLEQGEIFLRLL